MLDDLNSLQNLAQLDVVLTGDWASSPSGPRVWSGEAIAEIAIVGILFLSCGNRMYWTKSGMPYVRVAPQSYYESRPISNKLPMELRLHGLPHGVQFISSLGNPIGIYDASVMLHRKAYLPQIPHSRTVQTGHLFTFASFDSTPLVTLYIMFLARQDVKMRRKHIWRLRKSLLANLTGPLLDVFSFGRYGEYAF